MKDFEAIFSDAMAERGFTVRSLAEEIISRYGPKRRISRGLIGDYKLGKRAPTYNRALLLADVLGVNREEFLIASFKMKKRTREEAELARFKEFCEKRKIDIDKDQIK